uniref:Si:dkeyp-77h1.4 n=1 Tax=Fundulus heteroclitus TaxID=8078 RepID=A0A3Q2PAT8_FUNHE
MLFYFILQPSLPLQKVKVLITDTHRLTHLGVMSFPLPLIGNVYGLSLSSDPRTEESKTLLHGEDFAIPLPRHEVEVVFKNRLGTPKELKLMRGNRVISDRAKPTLHLNHLIIEAVGEGDEGEYILKSLKDPNDVRKISLIVRDCTLEKIVRYGGNFDIQIKGVNPPITLEYKPSAVEANQTSRPPSVVLTATGTPTGTYRGRISVSEESITIRAVTGADEGSYTVTDSRGAIKNRVCLNVKGENTYASFFYLCVTCFNVFVQDVVVAVVSCCSGMAQADLGFEDRLSLDGSVVYLEQIKASDVGLFKITDLQGFTVSTVQLGLKPYRMESLYVAIIALLGLLAFLLLVCLLSCLIKVKKRAKRAAALEKLAENAGKEDEGDAFRQVVKNITKLSEESKHSQADNTEKSQSTEVDIKVRRHDTRSFKLRRRHFDDD